MKGEIVLDKNLREKHYKRMKSFLNYDIEERDLQEQRIILEEIQNVAKDMLKDISVRRILDDISKTPEKEKFYMELYYREGKEPASIGIFNKDKLWIITNVYDVDEIIKFIENDIPCEKDNSIFYVDTNSIYSTLKENGYDVRELECKILNN